MKHNNCTGVLAVLAIGNFIYFKTTSNTNKIAQVSCFYSTIVLYGSYCRREVFTWTSSGSKSCSEHLYKASRTSAQTLD